MLFESSYYLKKTLMLTSITRQTLSDSLKEFSCKHMHYVGLFSIVPPQGSEVLIEILVLQL